MCINTTYPCQQGCGQVGAPLRVGLSLLCLLCPSRRSAQRLLQQRGQRGAQAVHLQPHACHMRASARIGGID